MKRWLILALLMLTLLVSLPPAAAQDGPTSDSAWSIYLVKSVADEILRVDSTGLVTTYDLGLTSDMIVLNEFVTVTSDGRVVYCIHDVDSETNRIHYRLRIRDLETGTNFQDSDLGPGFGCDVRAGLSVDESRVAVSVLRYYEVSQDANFDQPVWDLHVYDVATGNVVASIDAESPEVTAIVEEPYVFGPPLIQNHTNSTVLFEVRPIDWQTGVYLLWDYAAATVTPQEDPFTPWLARLNTTGRVALRVVDNISSSGIDDPLPVILTLPDGSTQTYRILAAALIDGGDRIALHTVTDIGGSIPDYRHEWIAIDEAGDVEYLTGLHMFVDVAGLPGGYATITRDFSQYNPDLSYWHTQRLTVTIDGERREVFRWHGEPFRGSWHIVRALPEVVPVTPLFELSPGG